MPLAPSLTTAGMQRHFLTSWWLAACWVSTFFFFFYMVSYKCPEYQLNVKTCFNCDCIVWSHTAPGGTLSDDMTRTEFCLFTAQEDLETMQAYAQVETIASYFSSQFSVEHLFTCMPLNFTQCCLLTPTPSCQQVFNKLIRRYKYLEKGFEEEIKKVSIFQTRTNL